MMPLISVVIPAYNAEATIASTLESVLAQDYENVEVIVVNDASTDRTSEISRHMFASGGRNGRVIDHEKNKGVCGARNTGFHAAQGHYIIFMDHDDLADVAWLSSLYALLVASEADIAFCGFRTKNEITGAETLRPTPLEPGKSVPADVLAEMFVFGRIYPGIWTMLFKSDFLREMRLSFTEGCKLGEDLEFIAKALSRSRRTVFSRNCLYTYRIHEKMVSKTIRATTEKSVEASASVVESQLRAAQYMLENCKSQRIRNIAQYYMMPKFYLKRLNIQAWRNDKKRFMQILLAAETKSILLSSRRMFFKEPGLFFKALAVAFFPGFYFEARKKQNNAG